jgi:hypothetical protein
VVSHTKGRAYRLRVLENRVVRRMFGLKRDEITGDGGSFTMRSLLFTHPQISLGISNQRE